MRLGAQRLTALESVLAVVLFAGCGRSGLDVYGSGGGPIADSGVLSDVSIAPPPGEDSGPCGPANCSGCCSNGTCEQQPTTDLAFCGSGGQGCIDCSAATGCAPAGGADGGGLCLDPPLAGCNCPGGCCTADLVCHPGTTNADCGWNQELCFSCPINVSCTTIVNAEGQATHGCTPSAPPPPPPGMGCGPCNGCCYATSVAPGSTSTCVPGTSNTACGSNASYCENCAGAGLFCLPLPNGSGARGCLNTGCGPGLCDGCCDASGTCRDGFIDGECGSGGASCVDCTGDGSTCDETVSPRVCTNQQSSCPTPYPSCPPGVTTPAPAVHPDACDASALAQARAACAGGATSSACLAFFQAETASDGGTACAACLQPFNVPFADGEGLYLCAAPFLDPSCNRDTGCYLDCETKSCSGCAPAEVAPCETGQRTANCATFADGLACVQTALGGSAAFCSPSGYANFGDWLGAVGAYYCGDGDAGP